MAFQETVDVQKTTDLYVLGKNVTPEESQKNLVYLGVRAKGQTVTREDVDTHWESKENVSDPDEIKQLKSTIQFVKEAFQPEGASSGGSSAPVDESLEVSDSSSMDTPSVSERSSSLPEGDSLEESSAPVVGSPRGSDSSIDARSSVSVISAFQPEGASSEESSTPVDGSPRGSDSSRDTSSSVSERSASLPEGVSLGGSSAPVDESLEVSNPSSDATPSVSVRSAKRDDGTVDIKELKQPDKITASTRLKEKGKYYVSRGESHPIRTSVRELYDAVESGKARMKNDFETGFFYGLEKHSAVYRTSEATGLKMVSEDDMHLDSKEVYVDFEGLEGLIGENFTGSIPDTKDVVGHLMIVKKDGRLPDKFSVPGTFKKNDYYTFLEKAASYVTTIVTAPKLFDVVDSGNPQLRVCDSLIPYHLIATPFPRFQIMRNGSKTPDHGYFIKSDGTINEDNKGELKQRFQRVFDMMCWPAQKKGMDLSMPMPSDFFSSLNDTTKTQNSLGTTTNSSSVFDFNHIDKLWVEISLIMPQRSLNISSREIKRSFIAVIYTSTSLTEK